MSDPRPVQTESTSVSRRRFLEIGGAGVAAGSLLTMLDARQAPAQIKGTNLRMLLWSHYVPAYDVWFDKFTKEWGDKTGVKVRVDHMPHLELRRAGQRRLVRGPRLLHLDPRPVAQGPLRLDRDGRAEVLGRSQEGRGAAQGQGASDGHAVLALQRRQPQLARPHVLLRRQGD